MNTPSPAPLVVNGWTLYAHALFLDQLEALLAQVDALRQKDPEGYAQKNATKRLAAIAKLAFEVIPQDPERPDYRQGATLGDGYKHWFRAKFFQQYRLFFRYHKASKVIVYSTAGSTTRAASGPTRAATTPTACSGACLKAANRPTIGAACSPSQGLQPGD